TFMRSPVIRGAPSATTEPARLRRLVILAARPPADGAGNGRWLHDVLVEQPWFGRQHLDRRFGREGLETAAALLDDADRPLQGGLEAGQLGVDIVLGLVAELAAVGLGLLDRHPGDPLGLPDDLGPLDHPL